MVLEVFVLQEPYYTHNWVFEGTILKQAPYRLRKSIASHYTKYTIWNTQCYYFLLCISFFANIGRIGCLDITEH